MLSSLSSQKISRGTSTNNPTAPQTLTYSDNIETHDSNTFLTDFINDLSKIDVATLDLEEEDQREDTSSVVSKQSSKLSLYEMEALKFQDNKPPIKIQFNLRKKRRTTKRQNSNLQIKNQSPIYCGSLQKEDKSMASLHSMHSITNKSTTKASKKISSSSSIREKRIERESFLTRLSKSFKKMHQNYKLNITPIRKTTNDPTLVDLGQTETLQISPVITPRQQQQPQKHILGEQFEFYYFDHGNASYFRTTDSHPNILSEMLAHQTTHYATKFWAEIFGALHIGVTFFVTFFLQAYRFLLYSIFRSTIIGFLQITSDYLIKPSIAILFNGFLQPPLILIYNIFSSLRDMVEPVADIVEMFLKPFGNILKNFQIISLKTSSSQDENLKLKTEDIA